MNSKKEQKKKKRPFRFLVYDFVKWTGALPILLWFRLKTYYESPLAKKKPKGGALICANHFSCTDPITLSVKFWYRRLHMVATKSLFDTKLKSWFFKKILCIEIDKENISINSYKEIISTLKDNRAVAIFPEGHLNKSNNESLDSFKSGVILMAMQTKVPIVPVHIIKREKWWQRQRVVVGDPIVLPSERMNLEEIQKYCEILREKEVELLEIYKGRKNK